MDLEEEKLMQIEESNEKLQAQKTMFDYQLNEARKRNLEQEEIVSSLR